MELTGKSQNEGEWGATSAWVEHGSDVPSVALSPALKNRLLLSANEIIALQRLIGNQGTLQLLFPDRYVDANESDVAGDVPARGADGAEIPGIARKGFWPVWIKAIRHRMAVRVSVVWNGLKSLATHKTQVVA